MIPDHHKKQDNIKVPKVGVVSLGCPKALVDVERILNQMHAEGYVTVPDYQAADIVLVNSCGFIDSAKQETLSSIAEALDENGRVIVTGCMGADPESILAVHPNVLAVVGPSDTKGAMQALHAHLPPAHDPKYDLVPPQGVKLTPQHYAYLKLSEGCNNHCSFCIIPSFRGRLASRDAAKILYEAERLVDHGAKELLVISQDTGAYGVDLKYRPSNFHDEAVRAHIVDLASALGKLDAWIRLHYVYPYPHIDKLVPLMEDGLILPYLDVPFQHASVKVLKAMRRPADQHKTLERVQAWRNICPELTIRSTFIVGFPGEGEDEFNELLDWLSAAQLDRVGAFAFEAVDGAPASLLEDQVPEEIKQDRLERLMAHQQTISAARLRKKVGTDVAVIIDEIKPDGSIIGRTAQDAPEIDGIIHLKTNHSTLYDEQIAIGQVVAARVTASDAHDLWGDIL
ncbi:MAG: 30S ribosomal protein S12 methylthiotransferase RimO [Alphaproteobacteria bacterium]